MRLEDEQDCGLISGSCFLPPPKRVGSELAYSSLTSPKLPCIASKWLVGSNILLSHRSHDTPETSLAYRTNSDGNNSVPSDVEGSGLLLV
jgi:hypothetical protein